MPPKINVIILDDMAFFAGILQRRPLAAGCEWFLLCPALFHNDLHKQSHYNQKAEVERRKELDIIELANAMKKPLGLLMPDAEEAMGPIALNLAANFFGLGNAATPFGVAAMKKLSRGDGIATDDMCMFLALNSSAIELLPTTVIALRTACGSADPYDIVLPTFIASVISAAVAALSCKLLEKAGRRRAKTTLAESSRKGRLTA